MRFEPRFGPASDAYQTFRPPYPDRLFERILATIPVDHRERAVDVGSGTGFSALPLCEWFQEVIAIEADAKMAEKLSGARPNLIVKVATAEAVELEPGSADLVTSATAFYWMDGPRVLEKAREWLRAGGTLAVYRYFFPTTVPAVDEVVHGELHAHWNQFRHDRLRDPDYSRRTVTSAPGWDDVRVEMLPNVLPLDAKQLAGFWSSTSYVSAYLRTMDRPTEYLASLEQRFHEAHPNGPIPVDFGIELILARKGRREPGVNSQ